MHLLYLGVDLNVGVSVETTAATDKKPKSSMTFGANEHFTCVLEGSN